MKKLLFIVVVFFAQFSVSGQNKNSDKQFILSGEIIGQDTGFIHLWYYNQDEELVIDSAKINQGNFVYAGSICYPQEISVYRTKNGRTKENASLFIEPAKMHIILEVSKFDKAVLTGSKSQNELKKIDFAERKINKQDDILSQKIDSYYAMYRNDTTKKIALDSAYRLSDQRYALKIKRFQQIEYNYFIKNPDSYISAYLLTSFLRDISLDSIKMIYSKFTNRIKNGGSGKQIAAFINSSKGGIAPDFSVTDVNDKLLTLSSFKDKNYVVLDFWASWCVPCRKNNPHLISIYNKYHSKGLEIIGISRDKGKDIDKWKTAIVNDETGIWHQVRESGKTYLGDVSRKYCVSGIPVVVLIDKTGKVLYRGEGNSKANNKQLDKELTDVFGF